MTSFTKAACTFSGVSTADEDAVADTIEPTDEFLRLRRGAKPATKHT